MDQGCEEAGQHWLTVSDFASQLDHLRAQEAIPPTREEKQKERRKQRDRRKGGRPRRLSDRRLEWAMSQILQEKARRAVIEELGIGMRTLERRLAERREVDRIKALPKRKRGSFLTFRCQDCCGVSRFPVCPYCKGITNEAFATLLTPKTQERKLSP